MSDRAKQIAMATWVWIALQPLSVLAAEEAEGVTTQVLSLADIMDYGGASMWVILALSIVGVFLVLLFLLTLRRSNLFPAAFIQEAENAAQEGDASALQAICADNDSAAAKIIGAAVEQMISTNNADYLVVRDVVEDEGARQAGILWQRIQYLMDVAIIAPMVGLLGTVLGMVQAFSGMQSGTSMVDKQSALAAGVSKAMYTTAGGLLVGIAAMVLFALFRGRVSSLIGGLESACGRVLRKYMAKR
ncbi:MAG: MotA/TolQ/ExbB proton channel family protein [Lentisphaeria bacterium]|nr:MotA/TolQ/ExbB proton channel family protein [Lentisphaeria bacterium]